MRLVLLTVLTAATATSAEVPARVAQTLTRAPTLKAPPPPRAVGLGGTVQLELELDASGHVVDAKVMKGVSAELDAAALDVVRGLKFTPAEVDGVPAPVRVGFELTVAPEVVEPPDAGAPVHVPVVNFEGTLKVAGTREPLPDALVSLGAQTVSSDAQGHFSFVDVTPGAWHVTVSAAGFGSFEADENVTATERTVVLYVLKASTAAGGETVVRATRERREVTQVRLERSELHTVAGTSGDAFKVLQSLPSVGRPSLGSSALVVRGSKAWDSRVYVDEVQVPQLFHFGGLSATFNSANVERIGFEPGNFGATWGNAIGGLVLADTRAPSRSGFHGFVDLSVFDASAQVEGPLAQGWAFSASAHRALTDVVLPWALTQAGSSPVGFAVAPESWDYQARIETGKAGRDRTFVSVFGSSDRYAFLTPNYFLDVDTEGNQGSAGSAVMYHRLVLGFDRRLGDGVTLISRNSLGVDRSDQLGGATNIFYRSTRVPLALRERLEIEVPSWSMSFSVGAELVVTPALLDAQMPPAFKPNQVPDPYVNRRLFAEQSLTVHVAPALFVEGRYSPVKSVTVIGGVRGDYESAMGDAWADPRLAVLYSPLEWLTLKTGVGLYHQPPDYRVGQLSTTFGNPDLLPEAAAHVMAGAEVRPLDGVSVDVQGWYKNLFHQTRQVLTGGLGSDVNVPGATARFQSSGTGRAYGADALVRWKVGKRASGWVAYTLSRVEREGFIAGGPNVAAPLDQPHNLIVVGTLSLPWDVTVGARFRFASGPLVTPVTTSLYDNNGNYYYPLPGIPWSQRLPPFFQLDLRVDKRFVFQSWTLVVYADVQNATNQQNPEGLFYNFNYTQKAYVFGIPVLPAVGARGEW